jgi:hypothetical protein
MLKAGHLAQMRRALCCGYAHWMPNDVVEIAGKKLGTGVCQISRRRKVTIASETCASFKARPAPARRK